MNLAQTIYLTLAAVASVIGIHQSIYYGIGPSYWIFMVSIIFLMLFRYNRAKNRMQPPETPDKTPVKLKSKKKR